MKTSLILFCLFAGVSFKIQHLKSDSKKEIVALVEIGGSHDECLFTQIVALKNRNCGVILVCTKEIRSRNPHFEEWIDQYIEIEFNLSALKNFLLASKMMRSIRQAGAKTVVFNTAQGGHVRNACWTTLLRRTNYFGIVHTTKKIEGSFTQKLINFKIKKYFFLSEYLLKKVGARKGLTFEYFYPLHFPVQSGIEKSEEKIITIVGGVENRRKDLTGFVEMIKGWKDQNVRFVFLGRGDKTKKDVEEFNTLIEANGLEKRIQQYYTFISQEEFDRQLQQSTAILLLVHPNTSSSEQYLKHQISGAMNVGFGYKIPLLIHEEYQFIEEMQGASVYYSLDNFQEIVANTDFEAIRLKMMHTEKWQKEFHEKRYANFVLGTPVES